MDSEINKMRQQRITTVMLVLTAPQLIDILRRTIVEDQRLSIPPPAIQFSSWFCAARFTGACFLLSPTIKLRPQRHIRLDTIGKK
jgi:hypothetical protein